MSMVLGATSTCRSGLVLAALGLGGVRWGTACSATATALLPPLGDGQDQAPSVPVDSWSLGAAGVGGRLGRFAGGRAVLVRLVQSLLRSAGLPPASPAFNFREHLPFLLSTQFKKNKSKAPREATAGLWLCGGTSMSLNSRPQTTQEAFHSKATHSKAAEGSLHRFMRPNPMLGRFGVNCVQTSFEKFLRSSSENPGWTLWGVGAAPCPAPPRRAGGRNLRIRALSFLLHHLVAA